MFHFAGRGGFDSREATVWERRLLGLKLILGLKLCGLTWPCMSRQAATQSETIRYYPQLFQQPLVKFFSPAQTRTLPWESLLALTSCYIASCYRRYQYQYGCHVQRHSLKSHWGYYLRAASITLKIGRLLFECVLYTRAASDQAYRYSRLKLSRYTACAAIRHVHMYIEDFS